MILLQKNNGFSEIKNNPIFGKTAKLFGTIVLKKLKKWCAKRDSNPCPFVHFLFGVSYFL